MSTPEENQVPNLPTENDLRKLSKYAVVAYAAIAARMVQPLFGSGMYRAPSEHIKVVDDAIRIAELFAQKKIDSTEVIENAYDAAATIADATANAAKSADINFIDTFGTGVLAADVFATATAARAAAAAFAAGNATVAAFAAAANAFRVAAARPFDSRLYEETNIRYSLCSIYEFLKENYLQGNDDPIDFRKIIIWENDYPRKWISDSFRKNNLLKRYWKSNNLNPWNKSYTRLWETRESSLVGIEPETSSDSKATTQPGTKPEISSNSDDSNEPCGGIKEIAGALRDVLIYSKDSLCVGILGQWGGGKSRLMKEVTEHFKGTQEIERFVTIKYNAWKYRNSPESWAYLYECFAEELRVTSLFAMIRAGVIRYGLWPIILALFFISIPLLMLQEPFHTWIESISFEQVRWGTQILRIIGFGGGSAILLFFLKQLYKSTSSMEKRFTLPNHRDKLGLQAAIGDDFHALIRGWTTIKRGEKFFEGQTPVTGILKIILYGTLLYSAFWSFSHLLAHFSFYSISNVLFTLAAVIFLSITLLAGLLFIPMLIRRWVYLHKDFMSIGKYLRTLEQADRILLVVDDLDRCEGDNLLQIMESIMLLCQNKQIKRRLHVCMLVEERTVEAKLWEKYKYLLKEPDNKQSHEYQRLIRENFEKLFDVHLSLRYLKTNVEEIQRSFLEMDEEQYEELRKEYAELFAGKVDEKQGQPTDCTVGSPQQARESDQQPEQGTPESEPLVTPSTKETIVTPKPEKPAEAIKFSYEEKVAIIEETKRFDEPYMNYWSPRSLKRLNIQYLLVRSLLRELGLVEEGNAPPERIIQTAMQITATILRLQSFKSKPNAKEGFDKNGREYEIIQMVVWKQEPSKKNSVAILTA